MANVVNTLFRNVFLYETQDIERYRWLMQFVCNECKGQNMCKRAIEKYY